MNALATPRALKVALARRAYERGEVRLTGEALTGCTHLVSTRQGLFAVSRTECRSIAHGLFFGLTLDGTDILAFEACDEPRAPTNMGRIVRLRRDGDRIVSAEIIAQGLGNGCHQIDLIGDTVFVTDTYRQRIIAIARDGGITEFDPIGADDAGGYVHINSLIAAGDRRFLMLHNGGARASEVAILDAGWRVIERRPLPGQGCHNLAILEDGSLLACGSFAGELISTDGLRVKITDLMTRGLSVGGNTILVGGSTFSERDRRDDLPGALYFLDRDYRLRATRSLPAPPMDIRRIDGRDLSLSRHVAAHGLTLRWPGAPPHVRSPR